MEFESVPFQVDGGEVPFSVDQVAFNVDDPYAAATSH